MMNPRLLAFLLAASTGVSQAIPLLTPGDPIIAIGEIDGTSESNYPAIESPAAVLDSDPATKYLNFGQANSGFIITPVSGSSTLAGLTFVTAGDATERDPASYAIYGTNDPVSSIENSLGDQETWTLIQEGALDLPLGRGESGEIEAISATAYTSYKLKFPTVRDATIANSMQIAEVALVSSSGPITAPGDAIIAFDSDVAGDTSRYPEAESPAYAIDGTLNKYLNFGGANTGFIVTPSVGKSRLESFVITTANDAEPRDPVHVKIYGTDDPITSLDNSAGDSENWTFIRQSSLTPPIERDTAGSEIFVESSVLATSYKVVFSHLRGGPAEIMQIAEIAFEGTVVPPNDLFEDRIDLGSTVPQTITGSNKLASTMVGDSINSVWWTWTAPADGKYEISTSGSSFATVLTVSTGATQASQVDLVSNFSVSDSRVALDGVAGTQYHIQVGGFEQGDIVLNISEGMPPANDDFANAEELALDGNSTGRIDFASTESGEPNLWYLDRSIWWRYTHSGEASDVFVEIPDSYFELEVYEGESMENLALIAWGQSRIDYGVRTHWRAETGKTYRIRVGSDYPGDFQIEFRQAHEPTNDDFANAALLGGAEPWAATMDTGLASFELGEPTTLYGDRGTIWWKWVAPESRTYGATGLEAWSNVSTYTGTSLATLELVGRSGSRGHTFDAVAGETYYFQVGGEYEAVGPVTFFVGPATRPAYDAWLAAQTPALPAGQSGVHDDPDKDGFTNSEEFAYGLDPNQPSWGHVNAPVFERDYDEFYLRAKLSPENVEVDGRSTVSLIGERSADLSAWSRASVGGAYPLREIRIAPSYNFQKRIYYRFCLTIHPNFIGEVPGD